MGGRVEATAYADAHADGLLQASRSATRTHLAGAVRRVITLRTAPTALATNGIAQSDIVEGAQTWLNKTERATTPPAPETAQAALQAVQLPRRWTSGGQKLPPVSLERLVDLSVEQGEPTREARNGQLPTTLWLVDTGIATEPTDIDAAVRKVAAESKGAFRPSIQALGASYRFVLSVPEGREPESAEAFSQRFLALRQNNESIVALNAIAGADGIPEGLDVDAWNGRSWTVWVSIASAEAGASILAVREALSAGGWDVHVISDQTDTGLAWLLGAWGAGGAVVSAEDPAVLAPTVARMAERSLSGREKAAMRQGPQPSLAPAIWRRVDPKQLLAVQLPPLAAQQFVAMLASPQPLGWWHETPVWLSFPIGDLAGTIGQTPLRWEGGKGSGPNRAWLANDVLRVADTTPVVERVRVNGRPALWAVPETLADSPDTVASSFWRLVEGSVDLRAGMRVDSLELRQRPLISESVEERAAP